MEFEQWIQMNFLDVSDFFFLPKITMIYMYGAVNANDFKSPRVRVHDYKVS